MLIIAAITEMANHAGNELRPSLEVASKWFDRASIALALSLLVGFVSTVAIIWLGIVKEHHWDLARERANSEIEERKAENLEVQKIMLPRRLLVNRVNAPLWRPVWLDGQQPASELFSTELQPSPRLEAWIQVFPDFEAQVLADDLVAVLEQIGWRPRIVTEKETGVAPFLIPEGLRVVTFRDNNLPTDGPGTAAELNRPINKAASALVSAMTKAGLGSPHLGVQTSFAPNDRAYLKWGFPYFEGSPPNALFIQVGVKPRALELLLLQSKQKAAEAERAKGK
jgi:hypothetical protein